MQINTLLANTVGNRPFLPVNTNQIMGFPLVVLPVSLQESCFLQSPGDCRFGKAVDSVPADKQYWYSPAIDLFVKSCPDGRSFHIVFTIVDIVCGEKLYRCYARGAPRRTQHYDIRGTFHVHLLGLLYLLPWNRYLAFAVGMLDDQVF